MLAKILMNQREDLEIKNISIRILIYDQHQEVLPEISGRKETFFHSFESYATCLQRRQTEAERKYL